MKAITILLVILLVFPSVYGDPLSIFCFDSTNKISLDLNSTQPVNYTIQVGNEQKNLSVDGLTSVNISFIPKKLGVQSIKLKILDTGEVIKKDVNVEECIFMDLPALVTVNSTNFSVKLKNLGDAKTVLIDSQPFKSDVSSITLDTGEVKLFNINLPSNVIDKKIKNSVFLKIDDRIIERKTNFVFGNPISYKPFIFLSVAILFILLFLLFPVSKTRVSKKNKKLVKKIEKRTN